MQRSKQHALMFLLGALLTGGVMGFAFARTVGAAEAAPCKASSFRDEFSAAVGLERGQRARLDSILDQRNAHMKVAMEPVRPQLDSIKNRARDQIRQMLTQPQRARFEDFLAQQDQKAAQTSTPPRQ